MRKLILAISLGLLSVSCAHSIHMVQANGFNSKRNFSKGTPVEAKGEQFVFMNYAKDNYYVDKAYDELLAQCPNGDIEAVSVQYSTSLGFLSWTNKVTFKGYCFGANTSI